MKVVLPLIALFLAPMVGQAASTVGSYGSGSQTDSSSVTTLVIHVIQALDDLDGKGLLCTTDEDKTVFIEYPGDDVVDGENLTIRARRNGVYEYASKGGAKRIAKYMWVPEPGQTTIHNYDREEPKNISGRVVQVTATGITILCDDGTACIIVGYPDESSVVDDDKITCRAKREGSHSFVNNNNARRTLPVYRYVGK